MKIGRIEEIGELMIQSCRLYYYKLRCALALLIMPANDNKQLYMEALNSSWFAHNALRLASYCEKITKADPTPGHLFKLFYGKIVQFTLVDQGYAHNPYDSEHPLFKHLAKRNSFTGSESLVPFDLGNVKKEEN